MSKEKLRTSNQNADERARNPLRTSKKDKEAPAWRAEGLPDNSGDKEARPKSFWIKSGILLLILWIVLSFGFARVSNHSDPVITNLPYSQFYEQLEKDNVKIIKAEGDTIEGVLKEAVEFVPPDDTPAPIDKKDKKESSTNETLQKISQAIDSMLEAPGKLVDSILGYDDEEIFYSQFITERPTWEEDNLSALLKEKNVPLVATSPIHGTNFLLVFLEMFVPIILIGALFYWIMGKQMGGSIFGSIGDHKPVDPDKNRVTFEDVAGIDEVEDQLREVVDMLRNPEKYTRLGAKIPRGILLEGGPGTGKTLLARATAGEAKVPFFSISAAEIGGILAGKGASDVRNLFEAARKVAPAIIFIDEIDAIGRSRARANAIGSNEDREQTLNQILTEMDGFDADSNLIVVAATNLAEVLDSALTRAGRFDRTITVSPPDQKGREAIFKVHVREHPLAESVDLEALAKSTPGLTGADIANLVNEASLLAARSEKSEIDMSDFTNALETIQLGVERAVVMDDEERERTAWHEGGHALLGMIQPGADPVRKISIIPRGRALGVTLSTPESDKYGYDKDYLRGRIIGALGGMAAEQEVYGVVTTGADSDLQQATNIARQMFGRWGMSEDIGPVQVYPIEGDPRSAGASEALLEKVDEEVQKLMRECYAEARRLLREHHDQHQALVDALLEKETLDEDEAYEVAGITKAKETPRIVHGAADREREKAGEE
ncbi:MAG: ATP-dependent zinc metalloprotease FtsH [Actinomycetaceae bacterium]|nr:ATP-dependent zinc metalloprotease FtsH [Actinomycetaceae bacterium]